MGREDSVVLKPHKPPRRAFTMIELLTVIGILMFMMAVLTGVFLRYGQISKARATQQLINRVGIALARYKAECRTLPPDSGYGLPRDTVKSGTVVLCDPGTLWRYLSKPLAVKRTDGTIVKTVGPFITFKESELAPYDDAVYGKSYYVVDAWQQTGDGKDHSIGYVGDPKRVVHNRGDFDLFSAGADGKTACNDLIDNDASGGADEANNAYSGTGGDAGDLGESALNGSLTVAKRPRVADEVLDDINNWDPQQ